MESKTRDELIEICRQHGISGYSGKRKADILQLIENSGVALTAPTQLQETPSISSAPATSQPVYEKEKEYLKTFLAAHRSKSGGYKRIISSPLRYAGGKTKAICMILENIPSLSKKKIVSPFFGGGSFEVAAAMHLGFEVIGYDIFGMLTNFWTQIIEHPTELANVLRNMKPIEEEFTRNRHILLNYWEKIKPADLVYNTKNRLELTPEEKTRLDASPLMQAAYYYYNMQLSYGPMFLGWPSSVYLKEERYNEILERVANFRPGNIKVSCDVFENVIKNHPDDFLFLDPPYYLGEDSKMFKGMYPNCNFAIHHNTFNHRLLAELLKKHKGGFLITYNDCPTIREFYKDYKQVFPSWQYTYGQGEKRIGKNREEGTGDNIKESHEIFIICPPAVQ
jgi:DNA adenine methylase